MKNPIPLKPSKEQNAILAVKKDIIVTSNPGTGKTTTLSLKVMDLLEKGVKPENILCITFTAKAKKEMFDAIYKMAQGKFPDSVIMKIRIHTFHGFAHDYLSNAGLISGEAAGSNLLRFSVLESFDSTHAFHYGKQHIISRLLGKVVNSMRYVKNFGITPDKINLTKTGKILKQNWQPTSSFSHADMASLLKYYVKAFSHYEKSKNDAVDYTDMLLIFLDKFQGDKFPYVLVDEMQDMNEVEAEIVKKVSKKLFLVGDAKQAIFGFQGGSIKNFQDFAKICKPMLLSTNRRSTQQILDYSKQYFLARTAQHKQFQKELANFKSSKTGPLPTVIATNARLAKTLSIIQDHPGKKIGIITRKNAQIVEISKHLDANSIEYASTSSQSITFQAKEEIRSYVKGRLSTNINEIVTSTLTSFSPFSLREAFEFSSAIKRDGTLAQTPNISKLTSWKIDLTRENIDKLFSEEIFPICVAKGSEWFFTAIALKEQIEEYLSYTLPTLDGLFDFIDIVDEAYVERNKDADVTLTTVHKAKGLGFDIVVYLPSDTGGGSTSTSFIDAITTSITEAAGIDVQDEIAEESIRIDFVAFTRAKEKLFIIGDEQLAPNFHAEKLSKYKDESSETDETVASHVDARLTEAYSLFVQGRHDDSKKLLALKEPWMKNLIHSYFKSVDHFSYSNITKDPYKFLSKTIIKIPYVEHGSLGAGSSGAEYGDKVHKALQKIMRSKAKVEDFPKQEQKGIKNGLKALKIIEKDHPGFTYVGSEMYEKISIKSITKYKKSDGFFFSGYLDLVFKHNDGIIIIDWKTNQSDKDSAAHKRQLAVYKKMYSKIYGIDEDKIKVCVIYVALRGGVNTGRYDMKIDYGTRNVYGTFDDHLQNVLEWRDKPDKFIKDLLDLPTKDDLHEIIKAQLQPPKKKKK